MFSIICATRGRPDEMRRLYNSATQTCSDPSRVEIVFYIDEDDTESIKVAQELSCKYLTLPRYSITLAEAYNRCVSLCTGDIFFGAGDDIVFQSKDWDLIVEKAFDRYPDKILLCGGYDGLNRELITHPFVHRKWIELTGRFNPPYFRDCYIDTWLNEVAHMVGRLEWLPLHIEHLHFSVGKSPYDQTAQERMSKIQAGDESGRIFMQKKLERIQEAEKLNEYIRSFKQ